MHFYRPDGSTCILIFMFLEQVEVATSAAAASAAAASQEEEEGTSSSSSAAGGQPVQTITINGQQYQIVSPASLSASQLEGLQTVSVASSSSSTSTSAPVVQYAATSQNGQTVFIPNTVSAAGGSGAAAAQV